MRLQQHTAWNSGLLSIKFLCVTYKLILLQPVISLIVHRFAPLVPGFLTRHFYCNVGKPAVLFGSVPVVAATRLKGDICQKHRAFPRLCQGIQIGPSSSTSNNSLHPFRALNRRGIPIYPLAWTRAQTTSS